MKTLCSILCLALLGVTPLSAQLVVNSAVTPQQLVNAFIGAGLTVSNITMNCPTGAYGTFNGTASNIGMANGALLTTGTVQNAVGPNTIGSQTWCNGTIFSDPQLTSIEPLATEDVCILEFDIVPSCSTLTINFVFGSEEYPEFVFSGFNDAFGFFITGPGPSPTCTPGFYNNTNVATLPDNITQVSIDNVNNINNSTYYFDNTGGMTVQYDGFTVVLTRVVDLCPCQSYHFKIAIADAGDCSYDSGVFLDFMSCQSGLVGTASSTPANCGCTGSVTANPSGGNPPYTYLWSPGNQTTQTVTGLCPGTYTVTIDDGGTCTNPITATVTVTGTAVTATASSSSPACFGGTGTATATPNGGTAPYTYSWSPSGGTNQTATGLGSGTYTVTITDANGCTATSTVTINIPSALNVTQGPVTNPTCGNANGSASVSVTGGTPGYTYNWSPSGGTNASATGLSAGTYTVTITDANGCTSTSVFTLTTSSGLSLSVSNITNPLCFGNATGSATANPTGGTSPYTFLWNPSGQTNATATGLGAGTYTVTVTDAVGCSTTQLVTITQPSQVTASANMTAVLCNGNSDGTATATAGGGTPGYSYLWSPSGGTNANATGLSAGTYTVTVTDANGCSTTTTVTVTQPTVLSASVTGVINATCGNNNGSATANGSGGTGPYTYSWAPSGNTAQTETGLGAGTYTVTITDANGCTGTATCSITQSTVSLSASGATTICIGQTANLSSNASGGSAPYTYLWQPVNQSGANISVTPTTTTTYTVTVTDANGCTNTATVTVNVNPPLLVTAVTPNAICAGGSSTINANGTGGNGNYSYNWLPSGTGSSITVSPTTTTTYTVILTDNCGTPQATATVTVTVNQPPTVCFTGTTTICPNDCVNFTNCTTGGSTYSWSFVGGTPSSSTSQSPTNICYATPGSYNVVLTATSAAGCVSTLTQTNVVTVAQQPVAAFSTGGTLFNGVPQSICVTESSTNSTSWSWTTAVGNSTQQSPCFTFTDSGTYCITLNVQNAAGCTDSTIQCFTIIIENFELIIPNVFTPNADNTNDVFSITHEGVKTLDIVIFNRWGARIYEGSMLTTGWDGKMLNGKYAEDGTYYYVLTGLKFNDEAISESGFISLLGKK